ncbi:Imm26 family immunity protein [Cytophagaceae bacterium YF14B1]|uniref:Imm26 family immunity protein n=1 Tax=Xanthocytophaga flava TaxID=3048013 RepID=A0AAE3U8I5_9BACT|nr:Imm26 family immunity protein [Xanthocytophaga flavus]MDJ1482702.1 Imm26 family immunity protein [Xanthocytophaga flavus]
MTSTGTFKKKRYKYSIGDLFYVPLSEKGYCVGLITHIHPRNKVPLGCFFRKLYSQVPTIIDREIIKKENVILVKRFGIQGFDEGTWSIIGKLDTFDKAEWPIPVFLRRPGSAPVCLVYYNEDLEETGSENIPEGADLSLYYEDGLGGSGFVEKRLTKLFLQIS